MQATAADHRRHAHMHFPRRSSITARGFVIALALSLPLWNFLRSLSFFGGFFTLPGGAKPRWLRRRGPRPRGSFPRPCFWRQAAAVCVSSRQKVETFFFYVLPCFVACFVPVLWKFHKTERAGQPTEKHWNRHWNSDWKKRTRT